MNISPQLVITSKMLQASRSELEQFVNSELADNPALERISESEFIKVKRQLSNFGDQPASALGNFSGMGTSHLQLSGQLVENVAQRQSPIEKLTEQVSVTLGKTDREMAIYLLHRLDHRGYLVIPLEELACELEISTARIERVIQILHQLEPPGIGARDTRECFLIQCAHLEMDGIDCQQVRRILTLAWDEFLNQQWDRVARKIQEPRSVVKKTCEFMRANLYPYPLAMLESSIETNDALNYPDLIIWQDHQTNPPTFSLKVPGTEEFELKISTVFQTLLGPATENEDRLSTPESAWIRLHVDRALMVIGALRQRWETLRRIGEYLIHYQNDFLEHGLLYLKPITRSAVAQALNVHESTISRAVSDKIVQLPNGHLIPFSDFFDPSLAAKEAIRQLVRNNAKPLRDHEIVAGLQGMGVNISRRTVTKYRREIKIDSSRRLSIAL
jgi:RNA polymerase sigma-54 factor